LSFMNSDCRSTACSGVAATTATGGSGLGAGSAQPVKLIAATTGNSRNVNDRLKRIMKLQSENLSAVPNPRRRIVNRKGPVLAITNDEIRMTVVGQFE
jgi:hypothetical protein